MAVELMEIGLGSRSLSLGERLPYYSVVLQICHSAFNPESDSATGLECAFHRKTAGLPAERTARGEAFVKGLTR